MDKQEFLKLRKSWKGIGSGELLTEDPADHLGHIVPVSTYNLVFASLLVLTAVTVFMATVDLGALNVPVALLIATVKVGLVGLFFMHLKWEGKGIWAIALYPLLILFLFAIGTFGDSVLKQQDTLEYKLKMVAPPVETEKINNTESHSSAH